MTHSDQLSRRRFVKQGGALAAAGASLPYLIPSGVLGLAGCTCAPQPGPNERIGIGFIGCGRRGGQIRVDGGSGPMPEEEIRMVAVADVNLERAEEWAEREKCEAYQDYRKLLDRQDVDAVIYATPEFWHYLPCIHACQAGKDIYGEQPLGHTIREGRKMVEAVRKYQRVFQVGEQQRSDPAVRKACELIRNGRIGKVHTVLSANLPSPFRCRFPEQPVPAQLDWDTWCGPNRVVPYHEDIYMSRANPGWMSFEPYSGGELVNWGCHGLSMVQWGLGTDETGPSEIWVEPDIGPDVGPIRPLTYTEPETRWRGDARSAVTTIHYRFADGTLLVMGGGPMSGGTFLGEKGRITVLRDGYLCDPEGLDEDPLVDPQVKLYESDNHMKNFLDCVRSRQDPIMDVEKAHSVATLCHLGNIARWLGRKLRWDPEKETFPGDDEANKHLDKPKRKPYELPETV
jgi:predicted dehydrogenase